MIESGRKAVYEAIVRRKSRAAIWRAIAVGPAPGARRPAPGARRPTGRLADWPKSRPARRTNSEISAGKGRPPFPQTKQIPCESMH